MKSYFDRSLVLPVLLIAGAVVGLSVWFLESATPPNVKMLAIAGLIVAGLVVTLIRSLQNARDISRDIPVEDEMSQVLKLHAGAQAFQLSMYLWLFIFLFHRYLGEPETLLGMGILGAGAVYGLCWLYFRFYGEINAHED